MKRNEFLAAVLAAGALMAPAALGADGAEDLRARIASRYDRVALAHLPTPLEEMKNLSRELGGPKLYIKRDDQTGLAFGGNKARKLEYIFADVLKKKADVVITWAGVQSNWARSTAAAARMHGVRPILVLTKSEHSPHHGGNLLLDALMDADVRVVEPGDDRAAIVDRIANEEREKGHRPYLAPVGGSRPEADMTEPLGAVSYAAGFAELYEQAQSRSIELDHVVLCTGGGGTQAGLMVGARAVASHVKIVGIHHSRPEAVVTQEVSEIATMTARALGYDFSFNPEDTVVSDDYRGEGYGVVTKEIARVIARLATTEGIMLDPVYTGKAMWGLIDLVEKGFFAGSRGVVFLHTGGTPALFVYEDELLKYLPR